MGIIRSQTTFRSSLDDDSARRAAASDDGAAARGANTLRLGDWPEAQPLSQFPRMCFWSEHK